MIRVENLSFAQGDFSLSGIDFEIEQGRYAVLMGKTGCGKTSLLEVLAGLKEVNTGKVFLNGQDVTDCKPAERNVGYVPQDACLFSTMKVWENLSFALDVRNFKKDLIRQRVQELAELLSISHMLERSVIGLSGGEKQRVALGRALAFYPKVLLLDEPLSAVDEHTKASLCDLLKNIQSKTAVTVLHVTHSFEEAAALGDMKLNLSDGRLSVD